jgi:competence protein ComEA
MRRFFFLYLALFIAAVLAVAAVAQNSNSNTNSGKSTKKNSSSTAHTLIDINSADKQTLMSLEGVGDVYSQKIIDGRPYKMKSDLVKRGIIPQSLYNSISPKIIAHQPPKPKASPSPKT